MFNGSRVKVGPGTLYAAQLGSPEPQTTTGAWPSAWHQLGYTEQGSELNLAPKFAAVEVEEEIWPVRQVPTGADATLTLALAELTAQNLGFVLNLGIPAASQSPSSVTTLGDGTIMLEPPPFGSEWRVMLGWDALGEGATMGNDPWERFVMRQALQTGTVKITHRKGNNKTVYSATFSAEKPSGVQPFAFYKAPALVS